jgi:hypothetical protein
MNAMQRIYDYLHERRIKNLSAEVVRLFYAGEKTSARIVDQERMAAIRARSPGQIDRMTAVLHAKLGLK